MPPGSSSLFSRFGLNKEEEKKEDESLGAGFLD
jgi:hypothetical protein